MKKLLLLLLLTASAIGSHAQQGTQAVRVKPRGAADARYIAQVRRNLSTYPLTTTGTNAFTAAVSSGALAFTITCADGTQFVKTAGTAPPAFAPCAPAGVTTLLSARASYNSATKRLDLEGAPFSGQTLQVKLSRKSGAPLTIQSSGGQALFADTYYSPGPLTGQGSYNSEWSFLATTATGSGVPQEPIVTTWKDAANNTYSYTFTPTDGTRRQLFSAGNVSPPTSITNATPPTWLSARYTYDGTSKRLDVEGAPVSTSNITFSIRRQDNVALSIQSSGGQELTPGTFYPSGPLSGQGAFTQEWSVVARNGGGVPAVPIVLTWKKPDGTTYSYTFTPATNTRATLFNASSGGGTNPPLPPGITFNYPIPSSQSAWPTVNTDNLVGAQVGEVARLESSQVTLEVRKRFGGGIQITDKATNRKLFDYFDFGRSSEITLYGGPLDFSAPAGQPWGGIGWDPITIGDDGAHGSPVDFFGYVTGNDNVPRIYVKTHLLNWPDGRTTPSRLTECWTERWIALSGREVDIKSRITFARSDQTFYEARLQEYPCFMVAGNDTYTYYYNGNNPYTGGQVTRTTNVENGATNTAFQQTSYNISEPWTAVEYDKAGHYIFHNTERLATVASTVYVLQNGNDIFESANPTTYNTSQNILTLDPNGTMYHNYGFYVTDNFNEGRTWANARPRKYGDTPNFNFNVANGRNDWWAKSGTDAREPFSSDGWKVTMVPSADGGPTTARRSELNSPVGSWKASSIPTLYVRMKYSGGQTQMVLKYLRNGQRDAGLDQNTPNQNADQFPNGQANGSNQVFFFNVINDGQYHTYSIPTSSTEWTDVIQQFTLRYNFDASVIPQEIIELGYVGATNPGN